MALAVTFELTGAGWMDIHLARDGEAFHLDGLSYLTPALDDVILAGLRVAVGDWRADALFELEPGTQRLRFERRWDDERREFEWVVSVAISEGADVFQEVPEDAFALQWEVVVGEGDEIARAVLDGAKRLEAKCGHAGYAAEWIEHPFPVRGLAALEAALAIEPLPSLRTD